MLRPGWPAAQTLQASQTLYLASFEAVLPKKIDQRRTSAYTSLALALRNVAILPAGLALEKGADANPRKDLQKALVKASNKLLKSTGRPNPVL